MSEFEVAGAAILGASFDPVADQDAFTEKEGIPFPLLADTDKAVGAAFGVADGDYAARATFVIKGGTVVKVWPNVSPQGHAAEVLEAVRSL